MHTLDLYKAREHSIIKLDDKEYKIPKEYTVEEAERLLELAAEQEAVEKEEVSATAQSAQIAKFYRTVFDQLLIVFNHYHPEVTEAYLRKTISHNEALEMLGFFTKYRNSILDSANKAEGKKKSKAAITDLRELRRLITFMVTSGFSLYELRKLYIDELYFFYEELIYNFEQSGKVEKGTYDKMVGRRQDLSVKDTISKMRRDLFASIAPKK